MKAIGTWISDWRHALVALGFAALALLAAIFVPDERWTKLGTVLSHIVADPAGATVAVGLLAGAVTTLRGAWLRTPPALALLLALGLASSGCGASALQTAALGTTVALRATHAIDQAYETDLERRLSECPGATSSDAVEIVDAHNACGDAIRAGERDIATVLDALPVAIEAFGAGVAVQTELDAGAAIPSVVLDAVRTVLSLFDQVEVMLRARGVVIPPAVDMVVRALSALLPPAPTPTTVTLDRPRSTLPLLAALGPEEGHERAATRPPAAVAS